MKIKPLHLFLAGAALIAAGYFWYRNLKKNEDQDNYQEYEDEPELEPEPEPEPEPKPEPEPVNP